MAIKKAKRTKDISVESYSHKGKKRKNNPPVGLVSSATDRLNGRTKYQHDLHLDPVRKHAALFMMSYKTIFEWCSISVSNGVDPRLVWAGKKEHTSFEVPTVSLHIHERIAPEAIIRSIKREPAQAQTFSQSLTCRLKNFDFYAKNKRSDRHGFKGH